jgi:hypothetical protein
MIRLQFVCGKAVSSRFIAWYGNGYGGYSHVDAVLPDGSLLGARDDAIGKVPAGVQIRPPYYESWLRRTVVSIPTTEAEATLWETYLKSEIGAPYDQQAIWGFILGRKDHGTGRWICSALQTNALCRLGKLFSFPVPDSQVTPDALFLLVTAGIGGIASQSFAV